MFAEYREIRILFFRTFEKGTLLWVVTSKWSEIIPKGAFFFILQAPTFYALNFNQAKDVWCLSGKWYDSLSYEAPKVSLQ